MVQLLGTVECNRPAPCHWCADPGMRCSVCGIGAINLSHETFGPREFTRGVLQLSALRQFFSFLQNMETVDLIVRTRSDLHQLERAYEEVITTVLPPQRAELVGSAGEAPDWGGRPEYCLQSSQRGILGPTPGAPLFAPSGRADPPGALGCGEWGGV